MSFKDLRDYVQGGKETPVAKDPATNDVNGENPNKQGTGEQERLKGETREPVDPRDTNKDKKPGRNSEQLKKIMDEKEENGDRHSPNSLLRRYLGLDMQVAPMIDDGKDEM